MWLSFEYSVRRMIKGSYHDDICLMRINRIDYPLINDPNIVERLMSELIKRHPEITGWTYEYEGEECLIMVWPVRRQ